MADLLEEVFPVGQGAFERFEGAKAAELLRGLYEWLAADISKDGNPEWVVGRRLVAGWDSSSMVAIEGLQVSPFKFGLDIEQGRSAILYDLFEFDGVLMDRNPMNPAAIPGRSVMAAYNNSQCWLSEEEAGLSLHLPAPAAG